MCTKQIWTHWGLDGQPVLQHKPQRGLQPLHTQHFNAGLHQEATPKIQACIPPVPTTLPVCPNGKTIWQIVPAPPPPWHVSPGIQRRYQTCPASYRKHPVLCPCRQPQSPHGTQHDSKQTSQMNRQYNAKNKTIAQLFCHTPKHNGLISCIRYDTHHSFRCILHLQSKCLQQSMQTFFHGMETRPQTPHQIKWGIF